MAEGACDGGEASTSVVCGDSGYWGDGNVSADDGDIASVSEASGGSD